MKGKAYVPLVPAKLEKKTANRTERRRANCVKCKNRRAEDDGEKGVGPAWAWSSRRARSAAEVGVSVPTISDVRGTAADGAREARDFSAKATRQPCAVSTRESAVGAAELLARTEVGCHHDHPLRRRASQQHSSV